MKKLLINYNLLPAYKEYCFVYLFFNSFILNAPPRSVPHPLHAHEERYRPMSSHMCRQMCCCPRPPWSECMLLILDQSYFLKKFLAPTSWLSPQVYTTRPCRDCEPMKMSGDRTSSTARCEVSYDRSMKAYRQRSRRRSVASKGRGSVHIS